MQSCVMQSNTMRDLTQRCVQLERLDPLQSFVYLSEDQMPMVMAICRECLEPTDVSLAERTQCRLHFLQAQSCNFLGASVPTAISNTFHGSKDTL